MASRKAQCWPPAEVPYDGAVCGVRSSLEYIGELIWKYPSASSSGPSLLGATVTLWLSHRFKALRLTEIVLSQDCLGYLSAPSLSVGQQVILSECKAFVKKCNMGGLLLQLNIERP